MSNEPVRLGIIGTGAAVRLLHLPALRKLRREYRITALANRTLAKAESLAMEIGLNMRDVYTDYNHLITRKDVDAVLIAVPPALNPEIVRSAMKAGKDVICEKPVAVSLRDAREMKNFPKRYGKKLLIAENFRYEKAVSETRKLLERKVISTPFIMIYTWMQHVPPDDEIAGRPWRRKSGLPGGVFTDHGVHMIDVVRFLTGDIAEISVSGKSLISHIAGIDTALFQMVSKSGTLCTVNWSFAAAENEIFAISLWSENGHMEIRPELIEIFTEAGKETISLDERESSFYYELLDFHRAIKEHKAPLMTLEEGIEDLAAIYRSYDSVSQRSIT